MSSEIKKGLTIVILIANVLVLISLLPHQTMARLGLGVMMSLPVLGYELPFIAFTLTDIEKTSYWVCFFGPFSMMPLSFFMINVPNFAASVAVIVGFLGILIISFLTNVVIHYIRTTRR